MDKYCWLRPPSWETRPAEDPVIAAISACSYTMLHLYGFTYDTAIDTLNLPKAAASLRY